MADPTRAAAKGAIKTASTEGADPELSGALSDAGKLRIELAKEDNRHRESMASGERGVIGWALGGLGNAPLSVGFIALVFGSAAWLWCLHNASVGGETGAFWKEQAERALAFAATALGFVFGRSTSK
jgi:hypothetical protein